MQCFGRCQRSGSRVQGGWQRSLAPRVGASDKRRLALELSTSSAEAVGEEEARALTGRAGWACSACCRLDEVGLGPGERRHDLRDHPMSVRDDRRVLKQAGGERVSILYFEREELGRGWTVVSSRREARAMTTTADAKSAVLAEAWIGSSTWKFSKKSFIC
jgi:hypothetical protein